MIGAPIIVCGMHNSGTSILMKLIRSAGVFVVCDMPHYETSLISLKLNNFLMKGIWYRLPIISVEEVLLMQTFFFRFLDINLPNYLTKYGYTGNPWGFKDPRICVLLPLYLRYFPNSRFVHIVRNPAHLAESLSKKRKMGVGRLTSKTYWLELTRQHVDRVRDYAQLFPSSFTEVVYEHLCMDPIGEMARLLPRLNLAVNSAVIATAKEVFTRNT